ncbi:hypothetical protein MtrunA17_Chr5g0439241 [Medicago truncatula]|uniref:Transmembrane protein, putative n=1 Tax=Medicago truncatula TaxID=3880 RepID=G7K7H9_MEDTR|nr:transmembrane protein, putative [Medicago truncatula]RHN57336.1 hypothetical protein MtrunA17_Chr5g0439241 [Medicago truncatula]
MALESAGANNGPRNAFWIDFEFIQSDSKSPEKREQDKDNKQEHEESQQSNEKELHQQSKEKGLNRYKDRTEKVPIDNLPRIVAVNSDHTYKDMVETLILVSTLIITASVAACFGVPLVLLSFVYGHSLPSTD